MEFAVSRLISCTAVESAVFSEECSFTCRFTSRKTVPLRFIYISETYKHVHTNFKQNQIIYFIINIAFPPPKIRMPLF